MVELESEDEYMLRMEYEFQRQREYEEQYALELNYREYLKEQNQRQIIEMEADYRRQEYLYNYDEGGFCDGFTNV